VIGGLVFLFLNVLLLYFGKSDAFLDFGDLLLSLLNIILLKSGFLLFSKDGLSPLLCDLLASFILLALLF
jgi:hypothetical protein